MLGRRWRGRREGPGPLESWKNVQPDSASHKAEVIAQKAFQEGGEILCHEGDSGARASHSVAPWERRPRVPYGM